MCYRIYYKVLHLVKLYGILKMHCLTLQLYQIKKVVISIHIIMKVQQKCMMQFQFTAGHSCAQVIASAIIVILC